MHRLKMVWVFLLAVCLEGLMGEYSVLMASHATHFFEAKGPGLVLDESGCSVCHADGTSQCANTPVFKSGEDGNENGTIELAETDVCNNCHSPGGALDGVDDTVIGAKPNWDNGVYDGNTLMAGKEQWCAGCHDDVPANSAADGGGVDAPKVAGDGSTYGFYTNGHGRADSVECLDCHDATVMHTDGEARTYAFNSGYYGPTQSGVAYAAGYRLKYVDGEVPLMIPANYNITFSYNAQTMKDNAFRLCFSCHDSDKILDNTPGDGIDSNFKASLPNPPRNYSYAWGSGADVNEHVSHILNYIMPSCDSDWDTNTTGAGGQNGCDTLTACSSCHNVHGAAGTEGSTNEAMVRDGGLAGRPGGYGFSYVIVDGAYPQVTSTGATQSNSVGAIFRYNTEVNNMCGGSICHDNPTPPADSSYDATGSSWGTYLEYYRPWTDYGHLLP